MNRIERLRLDIEVTGFSQQAQKGLNLPVFTESLVGLSKVEDYVHDLYLIAPSYSATMSPRK